MAGIAAAIRAGRLSVSLLEAAHDRRWAGRSGRTYAWPSGRRPQGVSFVEPGRVRLQGIAHPVRLLVARRT